MRSISIVLMALAAGIAAGQQPERPARQDARFHELAPHSLALSPNGRWLAFGRSSRSALGDLTLHLLVRDTKEGVTFEVGMFNYGNLNFGPRPVWSRDNEKLAYYAVVDDVLQLQVWDRKQMRNIAGPVPIDKAGAAELQRPQWTPDNRSVLFLSSREPPKRLWEEQEGDTSVARLRAELVGQNVAPGGATLLGTPALPPSLRARYTAASSSSGATTQDPARRRQVMLLDVATGSTRVLAQNAEFVQLQVADTGTMAAAGALDRSGNFSIYALSLAGATSSSAATVATLANATPANADGTPLKLLFQSSATEQFQNFNLSPSGRFATYLTEGSGNVVVVDLATGVRRDLTSNVPPLTPEGTDAELQRIAGRFDLPLYKGKFGTGGSDVPVWAKDESALLIRRVVARKSVTIPQRAELWRISRLDGSAQPLSRDPNMSIMSWAACGDRSRVNCIWGPKGEVAVLVRVLGGDSDAASVSYASVDTQSGAMTLGRATALGISSDFLVARETGDMVAVEEGPAQPPELWYTPPRAGATGRALNVLNQAAPPAGPAQRLHWTSQSGEDMFGVLRLPADVREGEQLPVILDAYPGRGGLASSQSFDAGRLSPLRTRARFALLKPDLPVKFGSGTVCADFARYAAEALDAAVATGRVDGARAGVMGISYGGYAVNCIVTHTDRFKAAVSEAGPADLASTHALGGRGEWNVTKSWPWETPERLVAESPVYRLDKVRTPLLLVAGKTDLNNALQEYEMYFGMLALGRPAALVSYDKAGHGDYDRFPDFWPRIIEWFDAYLVP